MNDAAWHANRIMAIHMYWEHDMRVTTIARRLGVTRNEVEIMLGMEG